MKFTSSNSLVHNQSIDLKHIRGGAVNQIVNIANTGSSDGCGAPGATNAANYISKSLKIQLYSGGVVVKSLAAIVYGFTDPQQGGFVAQYADIPETLSNDSVAQQMNMRLYFRLARYQGERGNVGFAEAAPLRIARACKRLRLQARRRAVRSRLRGTAKRPRRLPLTPPPLRCNRRCRRLRIWARMLPVPAVRCLRRR